MNSSSEIQHWEFENGDRSSEIHRKSASGTRNADRSSVMRRKTCTVVEKMLLEDGGGAQNVNRSSEIRETKCHESRWKSKFFDTENATLAQKGVAPSSGGTRKRVPFDRKWFKKGWLLHVLINHPICNMGCIPCGGHVGPKKARKLNRSSLFLPGSCMHLAYNMIAKPRLADILRIS